LSREPSKRRQRKAKAILVFGENDNDNYAIKCLVEALRPGLAKVEVRRRPIILSQQARQTKREDVCREIARLVAAQSVIDEVVSVIAHRDCDNVEPAHEACRNELLNDMRACDLPNPVAATPAFEIEAWWYLWPEALAKTRPCWNSVTREGKVGEIVNAKERLRRDLRPSNSSHRCPDYTESDSRKIAEHVNELEIARKNLKGSDSFRDFVRQVDEIVIDE
jgi:hypothetical protein